MHIIIASSNRRFFFLPVFSLATHIFRLINDVVQSGYPRRIGDEFPGLPENLDAALYYPPSGKTYVFKVNIRLLYFLHLKL